MLRYCVSSVCVFGDDPEVYFWAGPPHIETPRRVKSWNDPTVAWYATREEAEDQRQSPGDVVVGKNFDGVGPLEAVTLDDVVTDMICNSDHSDISEDRKTCTYYFDLDDGRLSVEARIDPSIIPDSEEMRSLRHEDYDEYSRRIDLFLSKFDCDFETLENDYFREAAEELLRMVHNHV